MTRLDLEGTDLGEALGTLASRSRSQPAGDGDD
jgi:hypothetical protein